MMSGLLVTKLFVLDMDRTLVNSDQAMQLYRLACDQQGLAVADALHQAQEAAEASAGSFAARRYIKERLGIGVAQLRAVDETFITLCHQAVYRDALVYPDARQLLRRIQHKQIPHLILTQGDDPEWQRLKLRAAGLINVPHIIAGLTNDDGSLLSKGQIIAGWQQPDGSFTPTGIAAEQPFNQELTTNQLLTTSSIELIDDKASSFQGLPTGCRGNWIQRGTLRPVQQGNVDQSIQIVHSLTEINL